MQGYDAPYVPGWDCHGLPIEIKVDEQLGRKKLEMPAEAFLKECRARTRRTYVDLQRAQFVRLGVFGAWDSAVFDHVEGSTSPRRSRPSTSSSSRALSTRG